MEDVLDVYTRPYDSRRPQVSLDEASVQLVGETRTPLPLAPGQPVRYDYEYAPRRLGPVHAERAAAGLTDDLAHAGMAEQMRVHRRRLADLAVLRGAQRQHLHVRPRRGLLDDEPGLTALEWSARAVSTPFTREKERRVVGHALLLGPQQELPGESQLGARQEHALAGLVRVLAIRQHQAVPAHVPGP